MTETTGIPAIGAAADIDPRWYRDLVETAPDGMVLIDAEGRIVLVNAQAERLFGYTREELLGQSIEMLVPEKYRRGHLRHREGFFAEPRTREMGAGTELPGRRKDGTEFPVEISLSPLETEEGVWATAAVRDVTERKAFERQLADYAENLKRSNRELEQFAYIASHDLRAPLRSLIGFSQLLQQRHAGRLDGEALEFLGYITQSAKQMQSLIDALLEFSRVSRTEQVFVPVDCEGVLSRVVHQLRALIDSRNAQITHAPLPTVLGVEHEIVQLFQNLVTNALKFQPGPQPRVEIDVQAEGGFWHFTVADQGIGIAREYHDRIFQIFQRLHPTEEYEGTGVGLAICKKIVEHHGGRIWVDSEPGKGSIFHFILRSAPPGEGAATS